MNMKREKCLNVVGMIIVFILSIIGSACGKKQETKAKLSPEQIESKYSSGVVLIQNSYYYTISFGDGNKFYFTGIDEDGNLENLTLDPNELKTAMAYGTGFIISEDGLIATNSHVASPSIDVSAARSRIMSAFQSMANEWSKQINEITENLGILQLAAIASDDYDEYREYQAKYNELASERDELQEAVNMVHSMGSMEYEAVLHTDLGIAYNDTHVTGTTDFLDCVTVADDPSHDLAIIQLKDKQTPEGKHIFKIPKGKSSINVDEVSEKDEVAKESKNKGVKVGKKLYMIGFNLGPVLALTNQGVKAQVTSGEVSQDTDDTKLMYTISSLNGSSGSPVIDEYGKLVAINFAGLNGTQNFNYGIKVNHLRKLLSNLKDE